MICFPWLTFDENNSELLSLICDNNQLNSLDITGNIQLWDVLCNDNQITALDCSQQYQLENLDCSNNDLECLDVANGNNMNLWSFISNGNENLDCIQVDDTTWNTVPPIIDFFMVDSDVDFSNNCNYPENCGGSTVNLSVLNTSKSLIKILDMMGRETSFKPNTPLIYVYDDGSTEKVFRIE